MFGRRMLGLVGAASLLAGLLTPAATAAAAQSAQSAQAAGIDQRWARPGPSAVEVKVVGDHTLFYPATMTGKRPVVVWGNGTFEVPESYGGLLRHLASHGFIVAAANTEWSGAGTEMLSGIDLLARLTADPASEFYRHVDLEHIGASGHSQGGQGAINAGADARIDTTVPIQPGPLALPGLLKGPALFLSGAADLVVLPPLVLLMWLQAGQVPAVYGSLRGAQHSEATGDGGGFRGVVTAWFAYQLTADPVAAAEFTGEDCGLCTDPAWTGVLRNAKAG